MQCNVVEEGQTPDKNLRSPERFIENHRIHGTDSSSSVHFTRLAKQKKT